MARAKRPEDGGPTGGGREGKGGGSPRPRAGAAPKGPRHLTYSDYINDRAIVESLRLPPRPEGLEPGTWPEPPVGWKPGDRWPSSPPWAHDEVLFIRTHQAFETWFALAIHELDAVLCDATAFWAAHGGALPRIDLGGRHDTEVSETFDRRRFPALASVVEDAVKADPQFEGVLGRLGNPGRLGTDSGLSPAATSGDFDRLLGRWTHRLDRARRAIACCLPFFDVLSTMTSAQFLAFRGRLDPASGFGSTQFRELEWMLGLREIQEPRLRPPGGVAHPEPGGPVLPDGMLRPGPETPGPMRLSSAYVAQTPWGWHRVAARAAGPSVRDLVYALLDAAFEWSRGRTKVGVRLPDLSPARVDRLTAGVVRNAIVAARRPLGGAALDPESRDALYRQIELTDSALAHRETIVATLFEQETDVSPLSAFLKEALRLDGAVLGWRDRHIRFVEEQIGSRPGTGGGGISYLRATTQGAMYRTHAAPCLWMARTFVQVGV